VRRCCATCQLAVDRHPSQFVSERGQLALLLGVVKRGSIRPALSNASLWCLRDKQSGAKISRIDSFLRKATAANLCSKVHVVFTPCLPFCASRWGKGHRAQFSVGTIICLPAQFCVKINRRGDFERQVAEIQIRYCWSLNRYTALGIPITEGLIG